MTTFRTESQAFTGTGTSVKYSSGGWRTFAIQVKGTGAAPTSWTVLLEGSLDGSNWVTILTHSSGDGSIQGTGSSFYPALYYRINVSALTLGGASNIVVTSVAMP